MLRLKTKTYQVPSADQDINTAFLSYNSPLSYKALSPSLFSSLSLCSVLLWTTYFPSSLPLCPFTQTDMGSIHYAPCAA